MATAAATPLCDPCKQSEQKEDPVAFCLECRELYCQTCCDCHRKLKATKSHPCVMLKGNIVPEEYHQCEACKDNEKLARFLCTDCQEIYCTECTNCHRKFKISKHHVVLELNSKEFGMKSTDIASDLAACSLGFDVTYSGAQVPIKKKDQLEDSKKDTYTSGSLVPSHRTPSPIHQNLPGTDSENKYKSLSATFQTKFSVKTYSFEEGSQINAIISMPDGHICVVVIGGINKIKLLSEDYVICDEVNVPWCCALTCVDDDTVAACAGNDIIFYTIKDNKITQTGRRKYTDGFIQDITYRRGEFITKYYNDDTNYTCNGSKVIVKQKLRGRTLDDFMYYDHVSDCVIQGNVEEKTVTCYTMDGDVKWRVTVDGEPRGLAVIHGVVLVADSYNHTINQLTMDGRLLPSPVLPSDHGVTNLYAMTYQHRRHRLLITNICDDNVTVFNLTQ